MFCVKTATPSETSHPSFPTTPSKNWDPIKPSFYETLVGGSTPPAERWGFTLCSSPFTYLNYSVLIH